MNDGPEHEDGPWAEGWEQRSRLVCDGCGNEIDPDTCRCGGPIPHTYYDGHNAVPMGCVCGFPLEEDV